MTLKEQQRIIYLRFGSIHYFRPVQLMTFKQIATKLRPEPETVRTTVLKF